MCLGGQLRTGQLPTPRDLAFQTDKGWAGIHRCLTDGRLAYDNGTDLLRACVLGGEHLYKGDDFVVSLLTPEQVGDVATVLAPIDKASLHTGYKLIDPADYGAPLSEGMSGILCVGRLGSRFSQE